MSEATGETTQEIFGQRTYQPEIGLPKEKGFFLNLLAGRQKPITTIEVIEQEGKKYCRLPPTDRVLVWDDEKGKLEEKSSSEIKEEDWPVLPISLAQLFNSIQFSQATPEAFKQALEKFPNEASVIKDESGKILAVILPAYPAKLAKPLDHKGSKWEVINLLEKKKIESKLVLISQDFNPAQLSDLVSGLEKELGLKENQPSLRKTFYRRFCIASQLMKKYYEILRKIQESGKSAFDPGYFPGREEVNQAVSMLQHFQETSQRLAAQIEPLLSQSEREEVNYDLSSKELEKEIAFQEKDFANRLFRLGVKKEKIKEIFSDQDFGNQFFVTRRVKPDKSQRIWFRYGHWIVTNVNQYLRRAELRLNRETPEMRLLEILAKKAGQLLLEKLDLPKGAKGIKKIFEGIIFGWQKMPASVKEWLKQQNFEEKLKEGRNNLQRILDKEEKMLPEEKKKELARARKSWEKFIVNYFELEQRNLSRYPQYPIVDGEKLKTLFQKWRENQTESKDNQLLDLLFQEQWARYKLAQVEQEVIERILDFQRYPRQGGKGYLNFHWVDPAWKTDYLASLEGAPGRIIVDQEISCVGRTGLVLAMMEELGLNPIGASTYNHSFLVFEDSFGIARVIEPSGEKKGSHYLEADMLFGLSRVLAGKDVIRREIRDPNSSKVTRASLMRSARTRWLLSVNGNYLENFLGEPLKERYWLSKLLTKINPLDEKFWNKRGSIAWELKNYADWLFSCLMAFRVNNIYFSPLVNIREKIIIEESIFEKNWKEIVSGLSPQEQVILIDNLDYLIKSLGLSELREKIQTEIEIFAPVLMWENRDFDKLVEPLRKLREEIVTDTKR